MSAPINPPVNMQIVQVRASGVGELGGNDFAVTLRTGPAPSHEATAQRFSSAYGTPFADEWSDMMAGTIMHELGHTLSLDHGGGLGIPVTELTRLEWLREMI